MCDDVPANSYTPAESVAPAPEVFDRYLTEVLSPPPLSEQETVQWLSMVEQRAHILAGQSPVRRIPASNARWGWTIAATVTLAIGVIAGLGYRPHPSRPRQTGAIHQYATAAGERLIIRLSDGSHVTLAPQSQLRIPLDFGADTRTVRLEGEAYFEVTTAANAPFIVKTNTVMTRVLGTTFDVRHYTSDAITQIAVLAGKVLTQSTGNSATIHAGHLARISDSTASITVLTGDAASYADWTNGTLSFDDVPAQTILTTLQRWYGYTFRVTDSALASRHVTAVFRIHERARTLTLLENLLDATLTLRDSTVILTPHRASTFHPLRHELQTTLTPYNEAGK